MKISIVATLYKSKLYINNFYLKMVSAAELLDREFELIFVNDGSPDNSLQIALELRKNDNRIRILDLSRNFGHHKAIMAGLMHTEGDFVFLIDTDLEEDPNWINLFWKKMEENPCDVVFGVQKRRKGNFFERNSGKLFYSMFQFLTGIPLQPNQTTARLMKKNYVAALLQHKEREIFLAGLWHITGFDQIPYPVDKLFNGTTTYSFSKKIAMSINSIVSFDNKILESIFYFGLLITISSIFTGIILIIRKLFFEKPLTGWTSIIVSIWFFGGLIILILGIYGIYLSKIFSETKQRPSVLIKRLYD